MAQLSWLDVQVVMYIVLACYDLEAVLTAHTIPE